MRRGSKTAAMLLASSLPCVLEELQIDARSCSSHSITSETNDVENCDKGGDYRAEMNPV